MADKKKVEVKVEEPRTAPVVEEPVVDEPQVVHHLDRRDSGTNWLESDKLPSLSDPDQS